MPLNSRPVKNGPSVHKPSSFPIKEEESKRWNKFHLLLPQIFSLVLSPYDAPCLPSGLEEGVARLAPPNPFLPCCQIDVSHSVHREGVASQRMPARLRVPSAAHRTPLRLCMFSCSLHRRTSNPLHSAQASSLQSLVQYLFFSQTLLGH